MDNYSQKPYTENKNIRTFSKDVDPDELIWHRDRENREVTVLSGDNWKFQFEDKLPVKVNAGDVIKIKKNSWHRIIKGNGDFIIKINKMKFESDFKNELNNKIKVEVKEVTDTNKNDDNKFDAVRLSIEGPDSISENIVTYQEANELSNLLNAFLKEKNKLKSNLKKIKSGFLFDLIKKTAYDEQTFSRNGKTYDVSLIWSAAEMIEPYRMHVKNLEYFAEQENWSDKYGNSISINDVIENPNKYPSHIKKIIESNLEYPIIIWKEACGSNNVEFHVADGLHRLAKSILNKKYIDVIFIENKDMSEALQ